jgi:hypothetical protein
VELIDPTVASQNGRVFKRTGDGETNREIKRMPEIKAATSLAIADTLTATVIRYPEALLAKAQELIASNDFSIATVVAHMACEIAVERTLSRAFADKGLGYLEKSVSALFSGYNLGNERIRNLYNAMTGNEIQNQSFWYAFMESSKRRNAAVHAGATITKGDAEASYKAASDLVTYLK